MSLLSVQQNARLKSVFADFSTVKGKNNERGLGREELALLLSAIGAKSDEESVLGVLFHYDISGKGWLDEPDFMQLMLGSLLPGESSHSSAPDNPLGAISNRRKEVDELSKIREELVATFVWADRDGDGILSASDLTTLFAEDDAESVTRHDFTKLQNMLSRTVQQRGFNMAQVNSSVPSASILALLEETGDCYVNNAPALSLNAFISLMESPLPIE